MTSLNGVRKLRLNAKETTIASFEILDVKKTHRCSRNFCRHHYKSECCWSSGNKRLVFQKNCCPRSLAVRLRFSELFRPAMKQKHNRTTKCVCNILFHFVYSSVEHAVKTSFRRVVSSFRRCR